MSNDNDNMFHEENNNDNDNVSNDNDNMSNEENEERINPEQNDKLNKLQEKLDTAKSKKTPNNEEIKSDYIKTPKCLIDKRIVINRQTKDNKSFMDAITLSLYCKKIGKNNTRSKNARKYSDTINWKNINFPPTGQDYKHFEANNENIKLNVLEIDDNEKIYYIYESNYDDRQNTVNVLLLEKKTLVICYKFI